MKARPLIDARGLQPGYKEHAQRGIGRYAKSLFAAMTAQVDPADLSFIQRRDLPEPELPPQSPRLAIGPGPQWLPGGERLVGQYWTLPRTLAPAWKSGQVVHILSHADAPARLGPRTVLTCQDLIFQRMEDIYVKGRNAAAFRAARWLETRCLSHAARILAISECTKRDLVELYQIPAERVTVVPLAADPGLSPVEDSVARDEVLRRYALEAGGYLFYLGGIDPRKDLPTLLQALLILREQGSPAVLALAGKVDRDKHYPALAQAITDMGLAPAVKFLGFVPDQDLPALYSGATAFAFPSLYEGFGLPPLEAMACGAPVVAVRAAAVPEVVQEAGILVPPGDARALAQALSALSEDPELARRYRALGAKQAERFSWERAAAQTLDVYEEVASAG
ncbi:MAG: glycosyltransferase family 4 protein [Desulfarculaceae bacterium]|nr:glycosyltransferase family 4 protein [Desulfarculaceae bacterium]MCF8048080.1 glycosyltransferase family 4 protein [Desulfarculaceae bacterium]MCF8064124.1 glycosyltransferase family 4 protein [Desulfarculaceae bacterium]MCF8096997.1 glycosyltransferase family 4 protein [Desulfarculaceae bacterium]